MSSVSFEEDPLGAKRITADTGEPYDESNTSNSKCQSLAASRPAALLPADEAEVPDPSMTRAHEARRLEQQKLLESLGKILDEMTSYEGVP